MYQFSGKTNDLTFSAQISPKMDLGFEIDKTNIRTRISILKILCVPIFEQKWITLTFLAQICPKIDLGLEIQKTNVERGILEILFVPIFKQKKQLYLFWPKFAQK